MSSTPDDVATLLRSGEPGSPLECSVEDLKSVAQALTQSTGTTPRLVVMGLYERLLAQFPDISQRLLIARVRQGQDPTSALAGVDKTEWWGPTGKRATFKDFLVGEANDRPLLLGCVGVGIFALLTSVRDASLMLSLNQLAVGSITIFISIFLIFSIAESSRFALDLFKAGRMHEFVQTDRHLAQLAVIALALAFVNVAILELPAEPKLLGWQLPLTLELGSLTLDRVSFVVPFTTSLLAVVLVDVFLASVHYYFERHEVLMEAEAASMIFHQHGLRSLREEQSRSANHVQ